MFENLFIMPLSLLEVSSFEQFVEKNELIMKQVLKYLKQHYSA